ncbi:MAG: ATP-binding cassette domain-containing protein [Bacteroidota bacterium]
MSKEVVVEIRDLKIQYGDTVILKDFNWTVDRGDRWALVGANGSGKTTLFSVIFADHPLAYSQQVYLFGKRRGTGESIWDVKSRINSHGTGADQLPGYFFTSDGKRIYRIERREAC